MKEITLAKATVYALYENGFITAETRDICLGDISRTKLDYTRKRAMNALTSIGVSRDKAEAIIEASK